MRRHAVAEVDDVSSLDDREAQIHRDAVAETHEAYTQFHGWLLTCAWCGHTVLGRTKGLALTGMQRHYAPFGLDVHS